MAIKILNLQGNQGDREFITEASVLSKLHHTNLVKLIGCCQDGDQRLLVYEYMPLGSLKSHLHGMLVCYKLVTYIVPSFITLLLNN
mgnify:CR=1 FL=1